MIQVGAAWWWLVKVLGSAPVPLPPESRPWGWWWHTASRSTLRPRLVCRPGLLGQRHRLSPSALAFRSRGVPEA